MTLAPCPSCSLDDTGRVSEVDPTWTAWTGEASEALLGRSFVDLFAPSSRDDAERARARVSAGPVRGAPLQLASGRHAVFAGVATPGAGSRWSWVWAADEEPYPYRALLEAAPDALAIVDEHGTIEYANLRAEALLGYGREELLGKPIEMLLPERARAAHVVHREGFLRAPLPRPMGSGRDFVCRRKDGTEVAVEVSLSPLETANGRVVQAAIRDITSRRAMEAETREAVERLRSAIDSMEDALAIYEKGGRLVLHNSAFRALFPSQSGSLVGTHLSALPGLLAGESAEIVGLDSTEDWAALGSGTEPARGIRCEGRSLRLASRRTAEGSLVVTISDRTDEEKRAEELRQASAAKTEFLSSMSHELRTPLNAVLGFAQLLERDRKTPLTERQREMIAHVRKGGEHLLRLIDDVLDLARVEAGRVAMSLEHVDVAPVLREVWETLHPMATRAGLTLEMPDLAVPLPAVRADRTRFVQILMNFGSNAIKYGHAGGRVTLAPSLAEPGLLRVAVSDDGIGVAPEHHDKLFQPFQRAGQETGPIEGTGIGLVIAKRLAELMQGRVGFRSELGIGSEFWVELPVDAGAPKDAAPPAAPAASSLADASRPRATVLYVEDNPSNVALMESILGDFDRVELLLAPSAEIGVELARAHRPKLVIMDINLPGMSGFEALRVLQTWPETRDIPVIALTAAAMERDAARAKVAGFRAYLTKPVRIDALVSVLEEVLDAGE